MAEKSEKAVIREMFAENLRRCIRDSGRSQAEIAEETGISTTALSNYCTGVRYPRAEQLSALAKYLRVSIGELTDDPEAKPRGVTSNEASRLMMVYDELDAHGKELVRLVAEAELRRAREAKDGAG